MAKRKKPQGFGSKESSPKVEGLGELINPIKFVIFQPKNDDYFAKEVEAGMLKKTSWCQYPGEAKKFSKFSKAEAKAKEIVKSKGYPLQICELYETEEKFATHVVAEVKP